MKLLENLAVVYTVTRVTYAIFSVWRDLQFLDNKLLMDDFRQSRFEAERRRVEIEALLSNRKPFVLNGQQYRVEKVVP